MTKTLFICSILGIVNTYRVILASLRISTNQDFSHEGFFYRVRGGLGGAYNEGDGFALSALAAGYARLGKAVDAQRCFEKLLASGMGRGSVCMWANDCGGSWRQKRGLQCVAIE